MPHTSRRREKVHPPSSSVVLVNARGFSAMLSRKMPRVVTLSPDREERGRRQRTKGKLRVREREGERERNDRRDVDDDDDGRVVSIRGRGKPAARRPRESFFFAFSPSLPRVSSSPCPPRATRLNIRLRFKWANACSVFRPKGEGVASCTACTTRLCRRVTDSTPSSHPSL